MGEKRSKNGSKVPKMTMPNADRQPSDIMMMVKSENRLNKDEQQSTARRARAVVCAELRSSSLFWIELIKDHEDHEHNKTSLDIFT